MKRYFYTDTLKAAIMAQEFGVQFETEHGERMEYHSSVMGWNSQSAPVGEQFSRFYVCDDSFSVFDPKDGDKDEDGYVYEERKLAWFRKDGLYDGEPVYSYRAESLTARRDNKHFFWPENKEE